MMMVVVGKVEKAPWYVRMAGKIVSRHIAKSGVKSFQCYGEKNWDYECKGVDVQVPAEDIISSIHCAVGDGLSTSRVRKKYYKPASITK